MLDSASVPPRCPRYYLPCTRCHLTLLPVAWASRRRRRHHPTLSLSLTHTHTYTGSSSSTCSPFQASADAAAVLYSRSIRNQSVGKATSYIGVQARDREATCRRLRNRPPKRGYHVRIPLFFAKLTAFFRKTYHFFPQTGMCTFRPVYIPVWRI